MENFKDIPVFVKLSATVPDIADTAKVAIENGAAGITAVNTITIGNNPVIIGMGGIFNKKDVDSYNMAGADFFGIGSALTNLDTEEAKEYLNTMRWDLIRQGNFILL